MDGEEQEMFRYTYIPERTRGMAQMRRSFLLSASEEGVPGSKQGRDIRWSERQSYRGRTRRGRKGGSP